MKHYVIDTNVLISFVTDRNLEQQKAVAPLFSSAARSKCFLHCPQGVITEFVFVLEKVYGVSKDMINVMVRDLIATPGVEVLQKIDFNLLLSLWPEPVSDYGDAVVAVATKTTKGATLVTFDGRFKSAAKYLGLRLFEP